MHGENAPAGGGGGGGVTGCTDGEAGYTRWWLWCLVSKVQLHALMQTAGCVGCITSPADACCRRLVDACPCAVYVQVCMCKHCTAMRGCVWCYSSPLLLCKACQGNIYCPDLNPSVDYPCAHVHWPTSPSRCRAAISCSVCALTMHRSLACAQGSFMTLCTFCSAK